MANVGMPAGMSPYCLNGHEFSKENSYFDPSGRRYCRECRRLRLRTSKRFQRANGTYKWDDPKRSSKWYSNNNKRAKATMRAYWLRSQYGITDVTVRAMAVSQANRCKICLRSFSKRKFVVDHNHTNGVVRGLLCYQCNSWLGAAKDNPAVAMRASIYLRNDGAMNGQYRKIR